MVADSRAEVDAGVAVGGVEAVVLEVEVGRRGHVVDLVAQRARLDVHAVLDARHAVDHERVRAGDVDHDRRVDLGAVRERHARDAAVLAADLGHLARNRNSPPCASAARWRLWSRSCGSFT